jgi:hypothetical protein
LCGVDADEVSKLYVELWKQTVAVQQHFNDLEWRIRQLALTAMTFALGAAALAAKDKTSISIFGIDVQLSSALLIGGLALWLSFYFVDQVWYHRLLIGAVTHGEQLERKLQEVLPEAGLTIAISRASPYSVTVGRRSFVRTWIVHSSAKLRIFYVSGAVILVTAAAALQFGSAK